MTTADNSTKMTLSEIVATAKASDLKRFLERDEENEALSAISDENRIRAVRNLIEAKYDLGKAAKVFGHYDGFQVFRTLVRLDLVEHYKQERESSGRIPDYGVYFVQHGTGGAIKIGFTTYIRKRMQVLQGSVPEKLCLLLVMAGDYELEAEMHRKFWHLHMHHEWFRPEPELLDFIASINGGAE